MKNLKTKFLLIFSFILSASSLIAQEKDVTTFLGIPVDGFKPDMIEKLKAKGYTYNKYGDCLEGEFNGQDVDIHVVTNNNKVYRICICDRYSSNESNIKIRFNTLCRQFEKNKRYRNIGETQVIPESTDISYEMTVHNKRFQASYNQETLETNETENRQKIFAYFQTLYPGLTKENMTDAIRAEYEVYYFEHYYQAKSVWFMIDENAGAYKILMYYDNLHNKSDGEDL